MAYSLAHTQEPATRIPKHLWHVKETRQSGYDPHPRLPKSKVNIDSTLIDQDIRERDSLSTNKIPGSLHFIDADKKHTVMTMQDNGAVGIGVQRPQAALDVNGHAHVKDGIKIGDYTSAYMHMEIDDSPLPCEGNSWSLFNGYSHCGMGIKFFTNTQNNASTERMRITPEGKVGIGTDDPQVKFHVSGSLRFDELDENYQTATALVMDDEGNVFRRHIGEGGELEESLPKWEGDNNF